MSDDDETIFLTLNEYFFHELWLEIFGTKNTLSFHTAIVQVHVSLEDVLVVEHAPTDRTDELGLHSTLVLHVAQHRLPPLVRPATSRAKMTPRHRVGVCWVVGIVYRAVPPFMLFVKYI